MKQVTHKLKRKIKAENLEQESKLSATTYCGRTIEYARTHNKWKNVTCKQCISHRQIDTYSYQMNYSLVYDTGRVLEFFENVMPKTNKGEAHMVSLLARKKYIPEDNADLRKDLKDSAIGSTIIKPIGDAGITPLRYLRALRRFNVPIDCYVTKRTEMSIPEVCLSLYTTINPRSLDKGIAQGLSTCLEDNLHGRLNSSKVISTLESSVQKSVSKKHYIDIDIDTKDRKTVQDMSDYLNEHKYHVVETRGGYHFLVDIKEAEKSNSKSWYTNLQGECQRHIDAKNNALVEFKPDTLCPIPGTLQGGFKVRRATEWEQSMDIRTANVSSADVQTYLMSKAKEVQVITTVGLLKDSIARLNDPRLGNLIDVQA